MGVPGVWELMVIFLVIVVVMAVCKAGYFK